jgi:cytochrome c oxidase assembly protein subunit 15
MPLVTLLRHAPQERCRIHSHAGAWERYYILKILIQTFSIFISHLLFIKMNTDAFLFFRRIGIITILLVYTVILAGGIVRASGAGMGCPDWPTCFGQLIPPTDEAQLPANYHEIYAQRGYANTQFNPMKTWTEYMNRLVGATLGIFVIWTAWAGRVYLKQDKTVFYLALSNVFLVGFQGWLGSSVVASHLKPLMITVHMSMAVLIVAVLIYTVTRSQKNNLPEFDSSLLPEKFNTVLSAAVLMTLLQISMGTQIREAIDFITNEHNYIARSEWHNDFPYIFYIHRSFSSIILFTNLWLAWQLRKYYGVHSAIAQVGRFLVVLVVTGILAGVSLDRLGFPAIAQPIHLLMANMIFGTQFFLYTCFRLKRITN